MEGMVYLLLPQEVEIKISSSVLLFHRLRKLYFSQQVVIIS